MTHKIFGILIILLICFVGIFFINYRIDTQYENGKFSCLKIVPRGSQQNQFGVDGNSSEPSAGAPKATIRIASFNLGGLDEVKLNSLRISDILVRLLPRFDLIALEGVRGKNQGVLVRLVEQINTVTGRQFDFATDPAQKRDGIEHYSAFLYDRAALEIDRRTVRFVEDTLGRFRHKPLLGAFRVRGIDPSQAFTFTLVAVEADPDKPAVELDLLAQVFLKVRDDGRNEDDVIMLGDFQADDNHLGRLGGMLGITAVISNLPTTTRGTQLADNIIFDRRATTEFTGRADVFDIMHQFDLTIEQAAELSEHLPIWADFSSYEGGQKDYVPSVPLKTQ